MEHWNAVMEWAKANPWTTVAIVAYVVANLAPRPHHGKMSGFQKAFWQIVDRLCVLTSHKAPGSLKFLLLDSPDHGSDEKVEKAPKVQEEPEEDDDGEDDPDSENEPAVVVDSEGEPDKPDEDDAEDDEDEGSDSDGEPK